MTRDLEDGESALVQGSGKEPYRLKNTGGVYSCTCPAWRNQGGPPERRTCKHLKALRGVEAEAERLGDSSTASVPAIERAARAPAAEGDSATKEPPLLLAHSWDGTSDLTGYWMSEKLDGVRAYWNGTCFVSRLGNSFHAPDWFIAGLPKDLILDGELFAGRKLFQRTVSIVRRQDKSDAWREISYVVFDAPSLSHPFEDRIAKVKEVLASTGVAHLQAHPHEICRGTPHLKEELSRVEALGGEGLMLRRPKSLYEVGRSMSLLKVKSFHDAEARVVGHVPGAGRHKGRVGALACELLDGTRFSVGTGLSDEERTHPPAIGAIVTFRYQELSNDGVPRFPSYVGIRHDVAFERAPLMASSKSVPSSNDGEGAMAKAPRGPTSSVDRVAGSARAISAARQAKNARFNPAPVLLEGEHVRLEPLTMAHAKDLLEAGSDESIWIHMTIPPMQRIADAEAFIASALADQTAGHHLPFATIDAKTGRVVGSTRYLDIQRPNRSLEIGGTWLTPSAQRTAINTESKRLLMTHAFESLGSVRVSLKTDSLNERSQKAIERIGGVREGTLRNHMTLYSGRLRHTVYFSVVDDEWPLVKANIDRLLDSHRADRAPLDAP